MAPSEINVKRRLRDQFTASEIRNDTWELRHVREQYSYTNSHSDIYRYLSQWADFEAYLNIGYSQPGDKHEHPDAHVRLVDRLATRLLSLRARGPYADDSTLLDIASGRGGPALYAHEKYALRVVGVDVTPYNVRRANRNSEGKKARPHVQFLVGNALALPIKSESFSLAWSIESPAHFSDKRAFLREAGRVLKPGSAFAFADLLVVDRVATASAKNRRIYEEFLGVWDVPYLETSRSYHQAIADAGFDLCETEVATHYNLGIFEQYCRPFLLIFGISPLYYAYEHYIKWRTGADLGNVYDHVLKSYRAMRLGMIDYGLFWAIRR
jgi:SAM-dependent methyltransferase